MQRIGRILGVVAMGVFVAYWRGWGTIDPFFFLPFCCFSAVLVVPLVGDAGQSSVRTLQRAVLNACAVTLGILLIACLGQNAIFWTGSFVFPETPVMLSGLALCLSSAAMTASMTALLKRSISPTALKWTFRACMAVGVLIYRNLPIEWSIAWSGFVYQWGVAAFSFSCSLLFVLLSAAFLTILKRNTLSAQIVSPALQ